jgi:acyl-CoA synthetase (AMP-forming)/AMP-acid ligase II
MSDYSEPSVSRVFRSSFPSDFAADFRTRSWHEGVATDAEGLKPLHGTLLHAFAMAAKHDDKTGITLVPEQASAPDQHRSYRELYHAAAAVAGALAKRGVKKDDCVLIVLPTSFEFVITFFAVELLGAIPVPSYPPAAMEKAELALAKLDLIAADSNARLCVTNQQLKPLLGGLSLDAKHLRKLVAVEDLLSGNPKDAPKVRPKGSDPAFIQYTSGSTGNPKGVLLTHTAVVSNLHAIGQASRVNRKDVMVSWLPLYHDMGLIGGVLLSIYWRLPLVLMSPTAFLRRPARWLTAIHRYKGTMAPSPNFGYALCCKRVKPEERQGLDLSSWRIAYNGAEPVNLRTVIDFTRAYEPHGFRPGTMMPVYGLAESSLAVAFTRVGELRHEVVDRHMLASGKAVPSSGKTSTAMVCVGKAVPGHTVMVVDEKGARLPEREVGHIVAQGPSLMREYYRNPEATQAVLRSGWLWTGDLGYYADGQLYVTGRAKDLIIVRGRNYYAEDIERTVERLPAARAGGVVAFAVYDEEAATDLVVIVCETKETVEAERRKLIEHIGDRVGQLSGLQVDEVVLVAPGTIPKTSSGKRQRTLCRERYLKDELAPRKTGRLRLMRVFARSGAGYVVAGMRRVLSRRSPE